MLHSGLCVETERPHARLCLPSCVVAHSCCNVVVLLHAEEHAQRPSATEEAPFQAAAAVDVKVISQHAHLLHGKVCFKIVF